MTLKKLLALLSLLALLVSACGGDDGEAGDDGAGDDTGGSESVTLETVDNEFQPAEFEVAAGEVEITLDNTGAAEHNFSNEELGVDEDVAAGEQTTFTVDAEPGTYEFVCKYHESIGMVGTMTVTE